MPIAVTPAKLRPVQFSRVRIIDRFWTPRITANREVSIPCNERQCRETGRIDAYKLDWKSGMPNAPHKYWDSDVAKFIEAVCYSLSTHPDRAVKPRLDEIVRLIVSAQQPDGYLNPHFTVVEPEMRWKNLRDHHELYCAGHLIEAAVAHQQTTGESIFIDAVCRFADHIASVFGREPGKKRGYCGCPEIELALVKLYRATNNLRYLELSRYFVDERGRAPNYFHGEAIARGEDPKDYWIKTYQFCQAHAPLREQSEVTGHAVRAMYIYCAMADLALELNDHSLAQKCEQLWNHCTSRLMYATGGLGSSAYNEGFTFDYDLPNESAYCETCASVAFVFWNQRMLRLDCDGRYGDVMERALYNGVLSGVSLDGSKFFYDNPLASRGTHHRKDWFDCSCCPPNIARLLASLGEYIYSESADEVAVHLYIQSATNVNVAGQAVMLEQQTEYPWDGKITLHVSPQRTARFALKLRRPGWCEKHQLSVNGKTVNVQEERGYLKIDRVWKAGDRIELNLPMPVARVYAHPQVRMNCGRVALQRGPLVYCLEGVDNGADLNALSLPRESDLKIQFEETLLGGTVAIHGTALRILQNDWGEALYRQANGASAATQFKAIPYYAWDNRAAGEMLVWIREEN